MPIPPLYGHEGIRNRLAGAIASGRLPQSLLLEGPRGVGKQRLALWLAQALVCEDRGKGKGEGCGACQHCKLVLSLSHPDVHWFVPVELSKKGADADKQVELVAEALGDELAARRERPLYEPPSGLASHNIASVRLLLRRLALTPALARRKVFILGDAERLVPQTGADAAANALLKALEEPPADTVFVLTATEPEALLPTILSRVVRVRVARLPDSIVAVFAQRELGLKSQRDVAQRVAAAEGRLGRLLATEDRAAGAAEAPLCGGNPLGHIGAPRQAPCNGGPGSRCGRRSRAVPRRCTGRSGGALRVRARPAAVPGARWVHRHAGRPVGPTAGRSPGGPRHRKGRGSDRTGARSARTGPGQREPPARRRRSSRGPGRGSAVKLSHVDAAGRARMVDVGDKPVTVRTAVAEGAIRMSPEAFRLVADQAVAKGDVLAVSEVAGTLAAKRTAELIPLCHPLGLDHVEVEATLDEALPGVRVRAAAKAVGRTGVEMEALTAVSVALLTVYDMVKAVDRGMEIEKVRLLEKTGGPARP